MRAWVLPLMITALGCSSAERGALRVDPALAALVPSDAVLLAGARMDTLRATPLYRKWVAGKPQPMLDRLAERIGLDPRKDFRELLIASDGNQTLAVARGNFAERAANNLKHTPRLTYKGYTLLGDERAALVFINSSTAAAGPAPALRALLDGRNRRRAPSALLAKAGTLPASTQVWIVSSNTSTLAGELPSSGNLAMLGKILAMLDSFTAAADLRAGLRLSAEGSSPKEADARTICDAVRGLVGLARLNTPDDAPELLRAYDGIRVEQAQRAVRLKAEIAEDLLDALLARFQKGGLPGPGLKPRLPGLQPPETRAGGK